MRTGRFCKSIAAVALAISSMAANPNPYPSAIGYGGAVTVVSSGATLEVSRPVGDVLLEIHPGTSTTIQMTTEEANILARMLIEAASP